MHVIHAADGMIPSDLSTGTTTRSRRSAGCSMALTGRGTRSTSHTRSGTTGGRRASEDPHSYSQRSRFLPDEVLPHFDVIGPQVVSVPDDGEPVGAVADVDAFLAGLWAD